MVGFDNSYLHFEFYVDILGHFEDSNDLLLFSTYCSRGGKESLDLENFVWPHQSP